MDVVLSCLVSDEVGPGQIQKQFIQSACEYTGMAAGFAFKEYKRAIEMAFTALELPENSKILLSPLTPQVYAEVIREFGLDAVFIDIDESSAAISTEGLESAMQGSPAAIIVYHHQGIMADMEKITAPGIPVIEDASQALGAFSETGRAGSFGDIVLVNLDPQNIITAGGGSLLLSKGRKHAGQIREAIAGLEPVYLLPDMNSALGFQQLHQIEAFHEKRKELHALFEQAAMKNRHHLLHQAVDGEPSYYTLTLVVKGSVSDIITYARKKNIEVDHAFRDAALCFAENDAAEVPVARNLLLRCLQFPLYPMLSKDNTQLILKVLSTIP
ncbi:MAG: DegT/DnrJ/EryC1/StrS aminotransferase family protein [Spirochaetales bacterium]|nr:DegT/DnrJ/EryC1/StrS aminotransferase family protein [Spirochaetales bacterium]